MRKITAHAVFAAAVVGCVGLGLGAGAAAAQVPVLFAPVGAVADAETQPMPAPNYDKNAKGLTFGSAAEANAPENEPDLIAAVATNGKEGFVYKSDLDQANGSAAAENFKSPEEALAWQENEGRLDKTIPVYAVDGEKVIGQFVVIGNAAQAKIHAADPIATE